VPGVLAPKGERNGGGNRLVKPATGGFMPLFILYGESLLKYTGVHIYA
jgi:hypothetical protein